MPQTNQPNQLQPFQIVDLSGLGMFPASDHIKRAPAIESLARAQHEIPGHTSMAADGTVPVCLNLTPAQNALFEEGLARVQALGLDLLPRSERLTLEPIVQLLLAMQDARTVSITADERGSSYDCLTSYFQDFNETDLRSVRTAALSLPPLESNCAASICIPVAAHEEERNIYRALKAFSKQNVDPSTYEIVLYLNHPTVGKDGSPIQPDNTLNEVVRFSSNFPHIRVRAFYSALEPSQAHIGLIRKFLNDVVAMRQHQRGRAAIEHILIRADADTHGVKPRFVENYLRLFDKHPHIDAFSGNLDWDWPSYLKDPALLFGTRLFMALNSYIEAHTGDRGGGGANFAIRTGRYADIGGYDPKCRMAEDVELGVKLKKMRRGAAEHIAIRSAGAPSILYTDSRRAWVALAKGHAPIWQWSNGDTRFDAVNHEIRSTPLAAPDKSFEELLVEPGFSEQIRAITQDTLDFYADQKDPKQLEYVNRVLPALGVQATLNSEGQVVLVDIASLIMRLRVFKEYGPAYWADILGFDSSP